ncbi:hypothetical protein AVEN_79972-1 [Araneus ventricosus]|uniref:Uncharacterized protein n=1 Tax=Araneus ventricosus TaxID=182803 RepID=A0A4Y2X210_ARAVE|nr:hypothetical protein AVEN_6887-1 [Araneus ventricosus]GBO42934.1 hypothetical protein AVEN_79972-1 [Araneus ventricosus]
MRIALILLPSPPVPSSDFRYPTSELENRCPLSKLFIREKSHMERDQGNNVVVGAPEYALIDILTIGGTCEPALYHDGAPTTRCPLRRDVFNASNRKLRACDVLDEACSDQWATELENRCPLSNPSSEKKVTWSEIRRIMWLWVDRNLRLF